MRILIADDTLARSPQLNAIFGGARGASRAKSGKRNSASFHSQVMISCAPQTSSRRAQHDECACSGLDLADQPEQQAAILDALGIALLNRGCLDEGSRLIHAALRIRRQFFGEQHPATAASLNSLSRVLREQGDLAGAETAVVDAIQINRAVFGEESLPVAINLNQLGVVQINQGRFEAAEQSAIQGIAILRKLGLEATDPHTTRLMDVRGRAEVARGKLEQADATYDALLKLDRKQLGTVNHPKYATHLANFGAVKEARKKFKQAESLYRKAIDFYSNSLNRPCHPNLIDTYANLGSLLRLQTANRPALREAGKYFERALRLDRQLRGETHVLVGNDHANLGRWHYDVGNLSAAAKSFSAALQIYERNVRRGTIPSEHFYIAESLTWQGRLLVERDAAAPARRAEPILEEAVAIWPLQLGPGNGPEAVAKACLGRSLHLQGKDPERARRLLEEAYPVVLADLGRHPLTARIAQWIRDLDQTGTRSAAA